VSGTRKAGARRPKVVQSPQGERALIEWLRRHTPEVRDRAPVAIGDDAAVLRLPGGRCLLFTTDAVLEGTHFRPGSAPYRLIGRKAMAAGVSDIAAMGGRALAAVVAVTLPRKTRMRAARELHRGVLEVSARYQVPLVGGNVASWRGPLAVTVSVVGVAAGRGPVLRSGARVGDVVLVTGELGGSLLGRHLRFEPRLPEGEWLGRWGRVHALIDLSDGLATDLGHILKESGCGAVVEGARVPVSAAARRLSRKTGRSSLEHALTDGEDYELCLVVPEGAVAGLLRRWPFATPLTVVGRIVKRGYWFEQPDGKRERLTLRGYEHTLS
jgi:thiamine-monophosphate kinase